LNLKIYIETARPDIAFEASQKEILVAETEKLPGLRLVIEECLVSVVWQCAGTGLGTPRVLKPPEPLEPKWRMRQQLLVPRAKLNLVYYIITFLSRIGNEECHLPRPTSCKLQCESHRESFQISNNYKIDMICSSICSAKRIQRNAARFGGGTS